MPVNDLDRGDFDEIPAYSCDVATARVLQNVTSAVSDFEMKEMQMGEPELVCVKELNLFEKYAKLLFSMFQKACMGVHWSTYCDILCCKSRNHHVCGKSLNYCRFRRKHF